MELKNSKIFNKEIMQTVSAFCESQEIKDVDNFIYLCFKQGFDIKKYGLLGKTLNEDEKHLIKEVIVEKRVEIPVEIIKEIEKIIEVTKEIPIEKVVIKEVVKEIPVEKVIEKEVYITDDSQVKELGEKITKLESEKQIFSTKINELEGEIQIFSTKTTEMENNFQNEMSKKNEKLDELRRTLDEHLVKPPVEIIKEVEKIVTNTEYIRDENAENQLSEKLKLLQDTLQNLRNELQLKNEQIKELEKINRELLNGPNQGYLLRGSNLNRRV
jgi:chromosome segregation ATPase